MSDIKEYEAMATSRDHVAPLPKGFVTVRIMQLILSVTIFFLSIFMHVQKRASRWGDEAYGTQIEIGLSILTIFALAYIILSTYRYPQFYNYWAILALDITFIGVWCVGFLFSTNSGFKTWSGCGYVLNKSLHTYVEDCEDLTGNKTYMAAANARWAVMGFAATLVILWLVSFIVVTVGIARHRKAGRHCKSVV
ncbi:hypothetical protein VTL71DRAFT_6399 [Oculimacula yallundae]|uniref:MARVEL domain-containing protein n=1 Tax=Oculimacula yallundae TaxID=86028 RepID=A0ABR4BWX3_9HELO